MFYEIAVRLIFTDKEDAAKLADFLATQLKGTATINKGQPNEEKSIIQVIQTNHEIDKHLPSIVLATWQ